jgi:hypothetical protein
MMLNTRPNLASSMVMIPAMPRALIRPHPSVSRSRRPSAVSGSFDAAIPKPYNVPSNPPPRGRPYAADWDPYYSDPYYLPPPATYDPVTPGPHYPVTPGWCYPVAPGLYSHSAPPAPPPGVSGPTRTTANRSEQPSPPILPSMLPVPPLPTPASAAGSGTTTSVPLVVLPSSQERMSTPPSPPSVPQEPPVSHQETIIPVNSFRDTGPTRHGVSVDIPSPSTPSVASVPLVQSRDAGGDRAECLFFRGRADPHAYDEGRHHVVHGREGRLCAINTIGHAPGYPSHSIRIFPWAAVLLAA